MASLVTKSTKVVLSFNRGLKTLSILSRYLSSDPPSKANDIVPEAPIEATKHKKPIWLDVRRGILGPEDHRLPLPGDTGLASSYKDPTITFLEEFIDDINQQIDERIKMVDRHDDNLTLVNEVEDAHVEKKVRSFLDTPDQTRLECTIQTCPTLLVSDFRTLFPGLMKKYAEGREPKMVALTICQQTKNDMVSWSPDMEQERDILTGQFIELAERVKAEFNDNGFWCNFIDPSSGRPFHGPYTTDTLFETDDRYRRLGFHIEDLGCCKVITHSEWGSKIFVGTIFTTADVHKSEKLLEFLINLCPVNNTKGDGTGA